MIIDDWKKEAERLKFDEGLSWTAVYREMKPYFPDLTDKQIEEKVRRALRSSEKYHAAPVPRTSKDRFAYSSDGEVHLYIISDVHIGAHGFDERAFRKYLAEIEGDSKAAVIVLGDLIDNATQGSKAYVYRELYKPGLYVSDAAELIKQNNIGKGGRQEDIYQWFAPVDLDNKSSQTGKSTLDILRESGIPFVKVSNRKVDGCVNMHEWLRPYQDEQEIWTAPLTFFSTCHNAINSISSIQCDDKDPNIFSDTPHDLTHAVTSIMYFTSGRPRGNKAPGVEKYPINSLEARVQKNLDRLTRKTRRSYNW